MINVLHLTHAYRQAPWRIQRQWAGAFLVGALILAMISALYLDVTAQAAILGREIQYLQADTIEVQHANADLQTRLATLLSKSNMEARARALGYRPSEQGEIHYVIVAGYFQPNGVNLAVTNPPVVVNVTPPEYTQSLLDWIAAYLSTPAAGLAADILP